MVVHGNCGGDVQDLWRGCTGTVVVVHRICGGDVQELPSSGMDACGAVDMQPPRALGRVGPGVLHGTIVLHAPLRRVPIAEPCSTTVMYMQMSATMLLTVMGLFGQQMLVGKSVLHKPINPLIDKYVGTPGVVKQRWVLQWGSVCAACVGFGAQRFGRRGVAVPWGGIRAQKGFRRWELGLHALPTSLMGNIS